MARVSSQPVELPHHEPVTFTDELESGVELWVVLDPPGAAIRGVSLPPVPFERQDFVGRAWSGPETLA